MPTSRRDLLKTGCGAIGAFALTDVLFAAQAANATQRTSGVGQESKLYKSIGFLKRQPSKSHEQFVKHWVEIHAPLFKPAPGLVKYSLNIIDPAHASTLPYDGAAELWFDNEASVKAIFGTELGKQNADDYKLFIEPGGMLMASTETVFVAPSRTANRPKIKRIELVRQPSGIGRDEFINQWREQASDYLKDTPGIRGYTLNVAHTGEKTPYVGYASEWWDDLASYQAAEKAKGNAATGNVSVVVDERIIV